MPAKSSFTMCWAIPLTLAFLAHPAPGRETSKSPAARDVRSVDGQLISLTPPTGGATVVVFYSTECPISNEYSPTLNSLAESHPSSSFSMVGICVDPDVPASDISGHAREYRLKFPVVSDRDGVITARFGAEFTPEAFVIDSDGKVRYRGRINDMYAERGKRNANPRTNELRDAVDAVLAGREVAAAHVEAIGCPVPIQPESPAKPTFARDVAPIIQQNCLECHRPGQVGPFSLVSYEQVAKRADDVAALIADRRMPPWKPTPGVGPALQHSKALTDDEIDIVTAWADAGAPQGDPARMPTPPAYSDDWKLGTPDLIVEATEDFAIPADGGDIYRCFVLPTNLPEDRYISAIDYRPGNRKVVHHVLAYVDTTGEGRRKDEADPGLGYSCFSGPGVEIHGDLGGWAPGMEASFLPEGIGRSLPSKSDVVMQVHYHPSGKPETDRTRIGIYFSKKPIKQIMHWNAALNPTMKLNPGSLNQLVEAGYKGTEHFGWEVPIDVTALAVTPHMHVLGRDMTMTVTFPDGHSQDLIKIGDWDFNWQNSYYFKEPIDLPKGSILKVRAHYDNTTDHEVRWGEATTDEMCIGFLAVVKKDQDLTKPGEKDDLGEIFRQQRRDDEENYKKMREEAKRKKTEQGE
ncbi:redoxin family protein [Tundrisphaera lichenicola]|uniref:redoxin family protein n=1 Tax=Tundrisphaera lichenicola TaxID=2029860 RepID=UPI003EBAE006